MKNTFSLDAVDHKTKRKKALFFAQLLVIVIALMLVMFSPVHKPRTQFQPWFDALDITSYVEIQLSNNQSIPTPANFDQLLKVDWLLYIGNTNSNVSNVRFYNSSYFQSSAELHAWLEDNDSNNATSSNVWVNLSGTVIPANGTTDIYMVFLTETNTWNQYWGLAPNLSTPYGQHDNGAEVFPFYANFTGTSLDSRFSSITVGSSVVNVDNGLRMGYPQYSFVAIITKQKHQYPLIFEESADVVDQSGAGGAGVFESLTNNLKFMSEYYSGGFLGSYLHFSDTSAEAISVVDQNGTSHNLSPNVTSANPGIRGIEWQKTGSILGLINDNYVPGLSVTDSTWNISNYYLGLAMGTGGGGSGISYVYWVRDRVPPPNNTMPSADFFAVQDLSIAGVHYLIAVNVVNNGTGPTEAPYNQGLYVDSAHYASLESSDLSNVVWFTPSDTVIPSWIQSGDSSSSTSTQYWLKMPFGLPPGENATIYMGFASTTLNFSGPSGNEGAYASASAQYGAYDNGAMVFPFYNNFSGQELSQNVTVSTSANATHSVDNGITLHESQEFSGVIVASKELFDQPLLAEAEVTQYMYTGGGPQAGVFEGNHTNASDMMGTINYYPEYSYSVVYQGSGLIGYAQSNRTETANQFLYGPQTDTGMLIGISWLGTGRERAFFEESSGHTITYNLTDFTNEFASYHIGIFAVSGYFESTLQVQWVRGVIMPLDGVMPTVTFGTTLYGIPSPIQSMF